MATTIAPETLTTVENDETVNNVVSDLSHMCEDFRMMYYNYCDWGRIVKPVPLIIKTLGDLLLAASSMSDFPLNERQPEGGYEFMKHPASFQASLLQICNSVCKAFKLAHTKIERICHYTQGIPATMKHANQILASEDMQAIEKLIPIQLEQLEMAATQSATCSTEVVQSFEKVMSLMDEVLTAVMDSKGFKEHQQDDARMKLDELKVVATVSESLSEELTRDKIVEEAKKNVHDAMRDMPSDLALADLNIMDGKADFLNLNLSSNFRERSRGGTNGPGTHSADVPEKVNLDKECLLKILHNVRKVVDIAKQLEEFAATDFKNMDSAVTLQFNPAKVISTLNTIAEGPLSCRTVEVICRSGITVTKTLKTLLQSGSFDEIRRIIQDFSQLAAELRKFAKSMKHPDSGKTPSVPDVLQTSGSLSKLAAWNARLKVLILQEHFKMALEDAEKARVRIEENREHKQALVRMKFSELNHGDAIKLLIEGFANLARLQQYLSHLELFYSSVSDMVELSMKTNLSEFNRNLNGIVSTDLNLLQDRHILDVIHDSAKKASETSYFVNKMALMYTKVSAKYIMPNTAKLNQLIVFDAEAAGMSIDQKRTELLEACTRDSEEINKLVMDAMNTFIIQIQNRKEYTSDQYPAPFNANEDGNLESENNKV